ncbi:MAG: ATP-binding protein [Coriobacteriales bacterium]|nr:ATP-binding protein [Coriobacteriales bacterium]
MLLSFTLRNFGPYLEECTFDMSAVPSYKEHEYNLQSLPSGERGLRVAALYGANASGKSQFVSAYTTFMRIVLESFRTSDAKMHDDDLVGDDTPYPKRRPFLASVFHPFALQRGRGDTEFEVLLEEDDGQYQFGFTYNAKKITSEWLYFYKSGTKTRRATTILERSGAEADTIEFGASVRRECARYAKSIPRDSLALSFLSRLNLKSDSFTRSRSAIATVLPIGRMLCDAQIDLMLADYFGEYYDDDEGAGLIDYLARIDISIKGFEVEKADDTVRVRTRHVGKGGEEYVLSLNDESDGTRKMIALYYYFDAALKRGLTLIIDELDAELHPLLIRYLVNQFHMSENGAQLIFTAHDVSLLNKKYLRRDQVWFAIKDAEGRSHLRSLAEYRIRNDRAYDSAYLAGVFGAVPRFGD